MGLSSGSYSCNAICPQPLSPVPMADQRHESGQRDPTVGSGTHSAAEAPSPSCLSLRVLACSHGYSSFLEWHFLESGEGGGCLG